MVISRIFWYFKLVILFNLLFNFSYAKITFDEAKFFDEGISIRNLSTFTSLHYPFFEIKNAFFFFDGKNYSLENIIFKNHNIGLKFKIEKAKFMNDFYEIHNIEIVNIKNGFVRMQKISSLGKLSVLDCELGYKEPIGWKFYSTFLTYDANKIFCIGNKIGMGKVKIPFFDVSINTSNSSGFIKPSIEKDLENYRYFKLGYYYLSEDQLWDLEFCPLIYFKDFGVESKIRSFDKNFVFSLFSERTYSYLKSFNGNKNDQKNNIIFHFEGKNTIFDFDMFMFNFKLYDSKIAQKNNYKNFSFLNRDYWGYFYANMESFSFAFLKRNDETYVKLQYAIFNWLKFKVERDFDKETLNPFSKFHSKVVIEKFFYEDFDIFLVDLRPSLSYILYRKEKLTTLGLDNFSPQINLKIDCPFFYLDDQNFVKFDFNLCFKASSLALLKKTLYKFVLVNNLKKYFHIQLGNFSRQIDFYYNDPSNYKLTIFSDFEILDNFSAEVINEKLFFGFFLLNSDNCYGLKVSLDQIIFEASINFNDFIRLKVLGSYDLKNKLLSTSNFLSENSYINSSFEILTNSWKIVIGLGFKNLENKFDYSFNFNIIPNECFSFEDIQNFINTINQEKKKLVDLYEQFQ